jgi:preprotein translocase subunit SecE
MDKTNSKILTLSFAAAAALIGFTLHLLIKIFAGAFGVVAAATNSDIVRHGVPVGAAIAIFLLFQFHPKIHAWADDVVTEVRKVVFPSRKDTSLMTVSVIIMVFISAGIVWTFDMFSAYVVKLLMMR